MVVEVIIHHTELFPRDLLERSASHFSFTLRQFQTLLDFLRGLPALGPNTITVAPINLDHTELPGIRLPARVKSILGTSLMRYLDTELPF